MCVPCPALPCHLACLLLLLLLSSPVPPVLSARTACTACLYCRRLDSPDTMTSAKLIERIVENRTQFEARQAKKQKSESEYYKTSKTYLQEI